MSPLQFNAQIDRMRVSSIAQVFSLVDGTYIVPRWERIHYGVQSSMANVGAPLTSGIMISPQHRCLPSLHILSPCSSLDAERLL